MTSVRSTGNATIRRTLDDLQSANNRLDATQAKLSSGKEIRAPEDDPFGAGRAIFLRNSLGSIQQYQRNVDEAQGWLQASDISLNNTTGILQRVRELTVQAANGTVDQSGLNSIATEVGQLREAVREQMNQSFAGRYIFAGSNTLTQPYPASTPPFTYAGNADLMRRTVQDAQQVDINIPGFQAFNVGGVAGGQDILTTLQNLQNDLTSGNRAAIGGTDLGLIDQHMDAVQGARATVGARANRLDSQMSQLKDSEINVQKLLSNTEDADMAKTMVDFSMQQNVYKAALEAGARTIQPSLLDFLR